MRQQEIKRICLAEILSIVSAVLIIGVLVLLVVATFRGKSLGMILAVLFGLGLTPLVYMGINEVLKPLFGQGTDIGKFMPDSVMNEKTLDTTKALLVAVITGGVFLPLAIRILDRKDVK